MYNINMKLVYLISTSWPDPGLNYTEHACTLFSSDHFLEGTDYYSADSNSLWFQ